MNSRGNSQRKLVQEFQKKLLEKFLDESQKYFWISGLRRISHTTSQRLEYTSSVEFKTGESDAQQAMKAFIDAHYQMMDINNDGLVSIEEYRYNCISRIAMDDIKKVDDSYNQLVSDEDNKRGGITLQRYQELYAQFMGNESDKCAAIYLYGPIPE
ncbi:hypothetical protein RP20_CCG023642 [Aedes albopictus]|nr:hypothetical protein RP20_CCG023642 [Aedes albopictus]